MKKRFLSLFMALIMMFSFTMTVFAIGEGDVDTGGGNAGDTDNRASYWRTDATGYRVTVLDKTNASVLGHSVDYMQV